MRKELNPEQPSEDWLDWYGNNIALRCPACKGVYIVSQFLNPEGRVCPHCKKSKGFVRGSPDKGGTASVEW
jgi:hypothetical protein